MRLSRILLAAVLSLVACSTRIAAQSQPASAFVPDNFVDVAAQAGVHFLHQAPHSSRKYLLETMGSGSLSSTPITTAV